MMVSITNLFTTLVSSCLLPHKKTEFVWNNKSSDSMNDGLKTCIPIIKDTYTSFLELDTPKDMSELLKQLLFELRLDLIQI